MIRICKQAGIKEPVFNLEEGFSVTIYRPNTDQVTDQVLVNLSIIERVVWVLENEMSRDDIQMALELKHRQSFRDTYLNPAMEDGLVEMTIPDKPTSSKQTYRLTKKGIKKKKELIKRQNQ